MLAMQNEPNRTEQPRPPSPASPLRFVLLVAGLALAACLVIVGGYVLLRMLPNNGFAKDGPDGPLTKDKLEDTSSQPTKPILFAGWGTPDLVIVVSGQLHGYLDPCGCSEPQYGGLIRRQTFIDELKAKHWPVVGVDLGELPALTGIRRQRELKLQYTMKALDVMGYRAVGLGKHEMAMPLIDALAQHSIDHATPRPLASSLAETEKKGDKYHAMNVRPYEVFGGNRCFKYTTTRLNSFQHSASFNGALVSEASLPIFSSSCSKSDKVSAPKLALDPAHPWAASCSAFGSPV